MSSAFVKEGEYRKLSDVAPSLDALLLYLRQENGGIRIAPSKNYYDSKLGRDVYVMSDGLTYTLKDDKEWQVILD